MEQDALKSVAAEKALEFVQSGMRLGLGTGSTASKFVALLGAKVADGLEVKCVATSEATAQQAQSLNIPLVTLDEDPFLDLTIDGADEIDSELRLIKGGGGALLREKIVAAASERMVVIADDSKKVVALGAFPLPIEVTRFGFGATRAMVEGLASDADCHGDIKLRHGSDGSPFVTDGGNYLLDCAFGRIPEPELLAEALQLIPGVVEHGLFLGLADFAVIAGRDGVELFEAAEI